MDLSGILSKIVLKNCWLLVCVLSCSPSCRAHCGGLTRAFPESVGFPDGFTSDLDRVLEESVRKHQTAGIEALVLVGRKTIYHKAFGYKRLTPTRVPLRKDTLFDLASLTKVVVTTPSILILQERGLLDLDTPVIRYLPEFKGHGHGKITLRHLLTHTSGLGNFRRAYLECKGKEDYLKKICRKPLLHAPGEKRIYSDVGMMLAGFIVERVSGMSLDRFAEKNIFQPLGMRNTFFNPPLSKRWRCAATEKCRWRHRIMQGQVHDENAYAMGGVAGHAGLFSTAKDLAVFCRMLLNGGIYDGKRILKQETVARMITPQPIPGYRFQALGWQVQEKQGQKTGWLLSGRSFGHTGFTGTSIWMDPDQDCAAILLANAIHPHREGAERRKYRAAFYGAVTKALEKRQKK